MNDKVTLHISKALLLALWCSLWAAASTVGWFECSVSREFGNYTLWPALAVGSLFPFLFGMLVAAA